MKNAPLLFLGLLGAVTLSWAGLVLGSQLQLGKLTPYFDEIEGRAFPQRVPGLAARGELVYVDLGCAACHTQQVRRPGYGSDLERGWGGRQSVARDSIYRARPLLGESRLGPDLANFAGRKSGPPSVDDLLRLLYLGSATHPSYRFLFETRAIIGQPSDRALPLTGLAAPEAGHEIVPRERALTLAAYLLSLNQTYVYPEARPVPKSGDASPQAPAAGAGDAGKAKDGK
ncbi:MAG: cbb3-type cytochrome c oxidase subunit II [Opitutus sp.]